MTEDLSYRNKSIALLCKSMDWFLYDTDFVMKELRFHTTFILCKTKGFFFKNYHFDNFPKISKISLLEKNVFNCTENAKQNIKPVLLTLRNSTTT